MQKSLGRAFIFSLIAFVLVGFIFVIIEYSIGDAIDNLFGLFTDYPGTIIQWLLRPVRYFPWDIINEFLETSYISTKTWYVGMFLSLIIASIIAGLTGGEVKNAFGGWALTMIFSIIMYIIPLSLGGQYTNNTCGLCTSQEAIIMVIIIGIVHLLIFGCITLLTALMIGRAKNY